MNAEELYFADERDELVQVDPGKRCIYKRVVEGMVKGRLTKCEICQGFDSDCKLYETRQQFEDWINNRRKK